MNCKDKLRAVWDKRERDVTFHFPLGTGTKSDAHYLSRLFDKTVTDELAARGYDVTTLKFEISPQAGHDKFTSQRPETK